MPYEIIQMMIGDRVDKACLYPIFYCVHGVCEVCQLYIFAGGNLVCKEKSYTDQEMAQAIDEGTIRTSVRDGERILIFNLITFKVSDVVSAVEPSEFLKEIDDIRRQLNGQKTTLDICRDAYAKYQRHSTEDNRLALREAFSAIPRHLDVWLLPLPRTAAEIEDAVNGKRSRIRQRRRAGN